MNKYVISLLILLNVSYATNFAQVGINIENPKALLHIDPMRNTTTSGTTSSNISDDFVITANGNVGIGTLTPTNKLTIESTGTGSDLYLPNGAIAGSVLTATDDSGNSFWKEGGIQLYTVMIGQGSQVAIPNSAATPKLTQFTLTSYDNVKDAYGNEYGWNTTNQQYVVPRTGVYRISFSLYINTATNAKTTPILGYIYKNGQKFYEPGFITISYAGGEYKAFISGIGNLTKGDTIDFRLYSSTNNTIYIWAAYGHTYVIIESL